MQRADDSTNRLSGLGCNQKSVFSSLSLGGRNKALPGEGFVTIILEASS